MILRFPGGPKEFKGDAMGRHRKKSGGSPERVQYDRRSKTTRTPIEVTFRALAVIGQLAVLVGAIRRNCRAESVLHM